MRGLLKQLLLLAAIPSTLLAQRADIAIVNGRVMDPASGLDAVRTVVVRDGHVVSITDGAVEAALQDQGRRHHRDQHARRPSGH
jgi:N-acyl-D-glutamate deacylase